MWREAQLRDIASGVHTTALGIRPCHCKRRWPCDLCGESFVCWNVWPFLWDTIPRTLRNKKLCRRCYGGQLLDVLGATERSQIAGEPEPPPALVRRAPGRPPAPPTVTLPAPGPRFRHYRRR